MRSQAYLEGTILYLDGRIWNYDATIDEAAEEVNKLLVEYPETAPTGVRVFTRPIPKFDPVSKRRQK